jgi:hypothetical protein
LQRGKLVGKFSHLEKYTIHDDHPNQIRDSTLFLLDTQLSNLNKMHKASAKQRTTTESSTASFSSDSNSGNSKESSSGSEEAEQSHREVS